MVDRESSMSMPCTDASPVFIIYPGKRVFYKNRRCIRMMSLNCRDLGMGCDLDLNGTNEREIMRKFIAYAETELKIPVLTADSIYRVKMAIKK